MKTGHSGVTEIASTVFREQVRFLLCSYPRTSHFCVVNRTLFDGVHDLRQHQATEQPVVTVTGVTEPQRSHRHYRAHATVGLEGVHDLIIRLSVSS